MDGLPPHMERLTLSQLLAIKTTLRVKIQKPFKDYVSPKRSLQLKLEAILQDESLASDPDIAALDVPTEIKKFNEALQKIKRASEGISLWNVNMCRDEEWMSILRSMTCGGRRCLSSTRWRGRPA